MIIKTKFDIKDEVKIKGRNDIWSIHGISYKDNEIKYMIKMKIYTDFRKEKDLIKVK